MAHRSRATDRQPILDSGSKHAGASPRQAAVPAALDSQVVQRAAQSNCTLLITGETGVGKGYLARWIHEHSPRREFPFIPVNCGAIPETLLDSQLFGHARGAFSGATNDHLGLIRAAERGSLLLDEVSELPPSAQNRLLRLLQDREVQPVGYSRPLLVDVRVIAASNIDLKQAAAERRFREDLLFRLDVIRLHIPPLRERTEELPGLIRRFNEEIAQLYGQPMLVIEDDAMNMLLTFDWPGNIRQVRSLIERLHVLCPGESVSARLIMEIGQLNPAGGSMNHVLRVEDLKQQRLRQVLAEPGGSIARAAAMFGVHRSTIYRWLRGS